MRACLLSAFLVFHCGAHAFARPVAQQPAANETRARAVAENFFPPKYPKFLKEVYVVARTTEQLRELPTQHREAKLKSFPREQEAVLRRMLAGEQLDVQALSAVVRAQIGESAFDTFLRQFGLAPDSDQGIELEVLAQIERIRRREAYHGFVKSFSKASHLNRMELVKAATTPGILEYALRRCREEEFESLLDIVISKDGFGPTTPQDRNLLKFLKQKRRVASRDRDAETEAKWRAVIAQLTSQPVGTTHRLPFSKVELFAMMRNAERTLLQRKQPFVEITAVAVLEDTLVPYAREIIKTTGVRTQADQSGRLVAYALLDGNLVTDLEQLKNIYDDIVSNQQSGQGRATRMSVRQKKELLEMLERKTAKRLSVQHESSRRRIMDLIGKILQDQGHPHRLPFIRGIVFLRENEGRLGYRLIEDFIMIVAGETYPYQWKHDNEVNIALLLANVAPYQAAQAVRFIIYHSMWRSVEARELGLYGWLPQIIFGNRQTGELPEFGGKQYYYFPDFRFRPTKAVDQEKERNRTSEIMQLPFFGWTVWRVYEELRKVDSHDADAFLKEVYPYVRANTEAIRTALDPYDEAVLSGRDAWVNGMDNAWYHLMVMRRHLPERLIPGSAWKKVDMNRVDNRKGKCPGCPIDPILATGRPSDYYYAFKVVFYDIAKEIGLAPTGVYHMTPYNAKDVAITAVMARSLEAQIAMARVLKETDADVRAMSALRGRPKEIVNSWQEETHRYQLYLDRMKEAVNAALWSSEDRAYYNRDVTRMFPGIVEQQLCRFAVGPREKALCDPRMEYWVCDSGAKKRGPCVLTPAAQDSLNLNEQAVSVSLDAEGEVHYDYESAPEYWKWVADEGRDRFHLEVGEKDPFLVEQFSRVRKDASGKLWYEPNLKYWTCVKDGHGSGHCELNEQAKKLMGQGARRVGDGDLLRSPAISGFFPLFGHIPSKERASELARQMVDPWMWWPVDGVPIPTQPMKRRGPSGEYVPNEVYDQNKYWLGPAWMASTKPVIDGFRSYGYEMLYLYTVQRTVGTLQDGRAVEHWNPETGEVNTSNINFPWSASCMAGSIWQELTKQEQAEYLERFRRRREMGDAG